MTSQQDIHTRIYLKIPECRIKRWSDEDFINCSIVFYQQKVLQIFHKPQKVNFPKNQHDSSIRTQTGQKIVLDMNYIVEVSQRLEVLRQTRKQVWMTKLTLQQHQNMTKKIVEIELLQKQKKTLIKYFTGTVWLKQSITNRYELVKQISVGKEEELSLSSSKPESRFLLLRDALSYENFMVKVYKRRYEETSSTSVKTAGDRKRESKQVDLAEINRQIYYQNLIKHRHIMRFSQFIYDQSHLYLFYQQKPSKLLSQHLSQSCELTSSRIKGITKQLLKAIIELQQFEILHNNIRASAVFVIEDNEKWKVSLGEFQYAAFVDGVEEEERRQVEVDDDRRGHLAPELIKGNQYFEDEGKRENCDVFSLGLLFYQMIFRKKLFQGNDLMQRRINNQQINFQSKQFKILSKKSVDLLQKMLEYQPTFRITPEQALDHSNFSKSQTYNPNQSQMLMSLNSSMMMSYSFESAIDQAYNKKLQRQNSRIRDKYFTNVMMQPRTQPLEEEEKENIEQEEMDDSHGRLMPRDARIMRPGWSRVRNPYLKAG